MKMQRLTLYLTSLYRAINSVNYRHRWTERSKCKCFGVQREEEKDVSFVGVGTQGEQRPPRMKSH
jgi:hypothetical protein